MLRIRNRKKLATNPDPDPVIIILDLKHNTARNTHFLAGLRIRNELLDSPEQDLGLDSPEQG